MGVASNVANKLNNKWLVAAVVFVVGWGILRRVV